MQRASDILERKRSTVMRCRRSAVILAVSVNGRAKAVQRRHAIKSILAGTAALLAGCGQKGPLFLPEEKLEELKERKEKREKKERSSALPPRAVTG